MATTDETPLTPEEQPIIRKYGLGRRASHDVRDRRFAMSRLLPPVSSSKRRTFPYHLGPTLDQGDSSQCVGYSNRHKLSAAPIMVPEERGLSAFEIYTGAQRNDEWPGEDYDGTSVRGAFKFLADRGYLKSYVWAMSCLEAHEFIHNGHGTEVAGTDWTDDMFTPDEKGFVKPTGALAGGHAYHLFWSVARTADGVPVLSPISDVTTIDQNKSEFWFQNSWGSNWGIKLGGQYGCFRMTWTDFQKLIDNYGEVGAGIELKVR